MWTKKRLIVILGIYILIFFLLSWLMPREHNWMPSFSQKYDWPFGNYILFNELESIFPDSEIEVAEKLLYNLSEERSFTQTNYLVISESYRIDSIEYNTLIDYVGKGNHAMLIAKSIDSKIMDTLNIKITDDYAFDFSNISAVNALQVDVDFYDNKMKGDSSYSIKVSRNIKRFEIKNDTINKTNPQKLAWSDHDEHHSFVRIPFGEGCFYLHSMPYVFTNYHMVHENTSEYISKCLSYLPNQTLLWDEYHKPTRALEKKSILHVFLDDRAMKWAYWIGLGSLILFIIFNAKRRQRIIPVLEEKKNESADFVRTVGALYYNNADHLDIGLKKIKILREYLTRKYHMADISFLEDDIKTVVNKTTHTESFVKELFQEIKVFEQRRIASEEQLTSLVKLINEFYKAS